ncbi:MFS transporter [Tepidicella baoligensis]|uniref:MFS transporter n=1 Tax=Tepidicella baoligensis TaxID=2707016 RepID=UPI003CCD8FBC
MSLGASSPPPSVPWREDARVMALVGLAHGISHFTHLLLPPLFPVLMSEFDLSFSQVGLLMSVFFVISGLGQASAGFVVDRFGARPVLFGSLLLFTAAALTASMADGYAALLLVSVLAGLGNAPFHPVDFSILNQRVSAPRLGHAFSVHGLTGNLGWAAAPVFLVGITALADWRAAYLAAAVMYLAVLALLWWQRDHLETEVVIRPPGATRGSDLAFMKLPVVWWCFAFFLLSTMTLAVVQTYSASILKAVHAVSLEAATFTLTAYMLCGALGMVLGGFVAGKATHTDRVVGGCMGAGALLMLLAATGWMGGTGTMIVLAITGLAVGVAGPSRDMMIRRATPKGATGRVYGTVYSGLDVGFAISPLIFGAFMDRGWYGVTLAGAAVVLMLSVFAALGVGRRTAEVQA